eukprot:m.69333 g.69333  ORF g.69333 m.69333 type:complete len:490 (+) comp8576_c2_seq1:2447-3916(+)
MHRGKRRGDHANDTAIDIDEGVRTHLANTPATRVKMNKTASPLPNSNTIESDARPPRSLACKAAMVCGLFLLILFLIAARTFRLEDILVGRYRAIYFRSPNCQDPVKDSRLCTPVILANEVDMWYHMENWGLSKNTAGKEMYNRWMDRFTTRGSKFLVHPYWYALKDRIMHSHIRCAPGELFCLPPNPWRNNQIARAITFLDEIQKDPRQDGFKVEKDKCLMTDWIALNGLPQPRRVGPWRQLPATIATLREIADGKIPENEKNQSKLKYPIFLKACHITQGVQHGTHIIKSEKDFKDNFQKHMEWVRVIWSTVSNDHERPWAPEAAILYPMVDPGIMLVEGWPFSNPAPAELKIEVFWGAAFMGFWLGSHPYTGLGIGGAVDTECNFYESPGNISWFCGVAEGAFALAERAASSLGSDEIRIDLFIHPTDPNGHQINEISLFSGHPGARYYKGHMGKAWLYGYQHPDEVIVADSKGGSLPQPYARWQN